MSNVRSNALITDLYRACSELRPFSEGVSRIRSSTPVSLGPNSKSQRTRIAADTSTLR